MIDVSGLRDILKTANIYVKENDKNFICICPYCKDHKNPAKRGHFYVSKDDKVPVCHCWLCLESPTINKMLYDLTGERHNDIVVPVTDGKNYIKRASKKKEFIVPELKTEDFPYKTFYMRKRTADKIDIRDIPNLIFDLNEFFRCNNLRPLDYVSNWEKELIQDSMVVFLSRNQTLLYCRSVVDESKIKFRKVSLTGDVENDVLDYYCIDNGHYKSNTVVLSEGNFDILGCYALDSLNLNNSARVYASGCTFSYEQLLKTVCLDYGIYRADVNILSDSDKNEYHYRKFINNTKPFVNSLNIYYNQYGKDFGNFPQLAVKLF